MTKSSVLAGGEVVRKYVGEFSRDDIPSDGKLSFPNPVKDDANIVVRIIHPGADWIGVNYSPKPDEFLIEFHPDALDDLPHGVYTVIVMG